MDILVSEEKLTTIISSTIDIKFNKMFNNITSSNNVLNKKTVYITRSEASTLLRITLPTLDRYTQSGIIPGLKIGSRILYREKDIHTALVEIANK